MANMLRYSPNQEEAKLDQVNDNVTVAGVNLPPDLIYEILCRLPAKSVGRFRCVSKDWQLLLSNPKFIKNQFISNNHQTKFIFRQNYKFHSIDFHNDSNNEGHLTAISEALTFMPTTNNLKYEISGSCNGLLLLHDFINNELLIVNPITHEFRQLPSIPQSTGRYSSISGFGYCENDDEYTVIFISDYTRSSPVYMLKRNLWKRVEDSPPLVLHGCGTFVNGCIHWLGSLGGFDHSTIVCAFDLASERFQEVENPDGLKKEDWFRVDVLGGCLCVVRPTVSIIDIWVMKEYGLRDSWNKYVVYIAYTEPPLNHLNPLFFWNGDDSIVGESQGRLTFCYLKQKTRAFIPVIGEQCSINFYGRKWTFVDSLFSPNSSNALEGSNQVQV